VYLEQVVCLHSKLQEVFDGMRAAGIFDDALIIIHGDHGSRITIVNPDAFSGERLSHEDYVDAFSTLFAVKAPEYEPGYDLRLLPIDELFAGIILSGAHPERPDVAHHPFVYLKSEANRPMEHRPMVNFGSGIR
jgi:hypothetical protein